MPDTVRILLKSFFVFICVYIGESYSESLDEGSACQHIGVPGICKKVINCPAALDLAKQNRFHELMTCGFEGLSQLICCPNPTIRGFSIENATSERYIFDSSTATTATTTTTSTTKPTPKRKSEKACEKIYGDNNIKPGINVHIIRGDDASLGQFPHMVALGFENSSEIIEWKCGASLISSRFLLTAAHCFMCNGCSDPKIARLGVVDIRKSVQDVSVNRTFVHPNYGTVSRHNDIGIIELMEDVKMTRFVYPACLYTELDDPKALKISGWGKTVSNNESSVSHILQYAVIEAIPITKCNATVAAQQENTTKVILETQICGTTESDTCQGDSGGPLQILQEKGGYAIVGVVSYGGSCGSASPGIYTRVAKYLDWIEEMVW